MMDSATMTISGNVVANPNVSGAAGSPDRVTFRVISNQRRRNADTGEWVQTGELGMNVVCWRRLARGVAESVRRGDPVVVIGRMTERHYTGSDGQEHWRTELVANHVGLDLSQGIGGRFTRFTRLDKLSDRDLDRDAEAGAGDTAADGPADAADFDVTDEAESPDSADSTGGTADAEPAVF